MRTKLRIALLNFVLGLMAHLFSHFPDYLRMLRQHLHTAGFFPICWAPAEPAAMPGTTYVRPTARGVLRVFVPTESDEVELYDGNLLAGKLRYRGPVASQAELLQLLARTGCGLDLPI